MFIREKSHRLAPSAYRGRVVAAFTINTAPASAILLDPAVFQIAQTSLADAFQKHRGHASVYVFMPNHLHWIASGAGPDSDLLAMVALFKQKTAFYARRLAMSSAKKFTWQKDFYDHIIRATDDYGAQVRYLLRNPVRRGLCERWEDWPYKGVLGQTWEQLLTATAPY
jgi:REP element-mobilizing transposase RayT